MRPRLRLPCILVIPLLLHAHGVARAQEPLPFGRLELEAAIGLMGRNDGSPLEELRRAYLLAAEDGDAFDEAYSRLVTLEEAWAGASGHASPADPVLLGYRGALEAVRARHARWPPTRISHLRAGQRLLDEAVALSPADAEVRALRLLTEAHVPRILRRDGVLREEQKWLARQLEEEPGALSPGLERIVAVILERLSR
jgi:hypothetical protein